MPVAASSRPMSLPIGIADPFLDSLGQAEMLAEFGRVFHGVRYEPSTIKTRAGRSCRIPIDGGLGLLVHPLQQRLQ